MPKILEPSVKQEVENLVARARREGKRLTVDYVHSIIKNSKRNKRGAGRTTVYKLKKQAESGILQDVLPDPPWDPSPKEWPPEAYGFLLSLNRHCVRGVDNSSNDAMPETESRQLTKREAQWGARVYSVCPKELIEIGYLVVSTLAEREIVAEMYGKPMVIDDVIGYLEYRPWESEDAAQTYRLACKLGRIPEIGRIAELSEPLLGVPGLKEIEETVEITPSAIVDSEEWLQMLNKRLEPGQRKTWDQLMNMVEQADLIRQYVSEQLDVIWRSERYEGLRKEPNISPATNATLLGYVDKETGLG